MTNVTGYYLECAHLCFPVFLINKRKSLCMIVSFSFLGNCQTLIFENVPNDVIRTGNYSAFDSSTGSRNWTLCNISISSISVMTINYIYIYIYIYIYQYFVMEHHWKKHLATWGLEPASPVSVNRHAML